MRFALCLILRGDNDSLMNVTKYEVDCDNKDRESCC